MSGRIFGTVRSIPPPSVVQSFAKYLNFAQQVTCNIFFRIRTETVSQIMTKFRDMEFINCCFNSRQDLIQKLDQKTNSEVMFKSLSAMIIFR